VVVHWTDKSVLIRMNDSIRLEKYGTTQSTTSGRKTKTSEGSDTSLTIDTVFGSTTTVSPLRTTATVDTYPISNLPISARRSCGYGWTRLRCEGGGRRRTSNTFLTIDTMCRHNSQFVATEAILSGSPTVSGWTD